MIQLVESIEIDSYSFHHFRLNRQYTFRDNHGDVCLGQDTSMIVFKEISALESNCDRLGDRFDGILPFAQRWTRTRVVSNTARPLSPVYHSTTRTTRLIICC